MPVPVKTGFTPPPMPGMPAPMQPMGAPMGGGMPPAPAPNPFAPLPPAPLAGPQVPPPMPQQPVQGQGQQMMASNAGRRRKFGDALEGMLGRNQGIGAAVPQQRPLPMPQMMPRQQMVAPGTPMMRTPSPRPMAMGGEVDIFGYENGGPVGSTPIQHFADGKEVKSVAGYPDAPEGAYYSPYETSYSAGGILDFIENNPGGYNAAYDLFPDGKVDFTDVQMARGSATSALRYDPETKTFRQDADYLPESILQYRVGQNVLDPETGFAVPAYPGALRDEYDELARKLNDYITEFAGGLPALEQRLEGFAGSTGISLSDLGKSNETLFKQYVENKGYEYMPRDYNLYNDPRFDPTLAPGQGGIIDNKFALYSGDNSLLNQFNQEIDEYRDLARDYSDYSGAESALSSFEQQQRNAYEQAKQDYIDQYGLTGTAYNLRYYEPEYDPATQYLTGDDISGFNVLYKKPDFDPDTQYLTGNEYEGFQVVDIPTNTVVETVDNTVSMPEYNPETQRLVWDEASGSWIVEDIVTEPVIPYYDPTSQELVYDPTTNTYSVRDIMPVTPVETITGSESGAGSASNVATVSGDGTITPIETGNFGTGTYTASPVSSVEVNPIDYTQFTGDTGVVTGGYDVVDANTGVVTPGTSEQSTLFGPRVTIPTSVSQYQTSDVVDDSGNVVRGLTTTYGPEMVTTSPIGAIKLPARPVDIDIFDWLSTPTYGTMYSDINPIDTSVYSDIKPIGLRNGGSVPVPFMDGGPVQYYENAGEVLKSGFGIAQARDSEGNIVPGMFVAKYADGTYSAPVTASNIEGLRQGLLTGRVTSGDYTADEAAEMAAKDLYLRAGDVAVTDRDVSGGFGGPLGMSNEMIGNDTVFVRFGDGTVVTAQKGMVDAMNEYGLLDNMQSRDDFTKTMLDISSASVRDPESDLAKAHSLFNEKQIAYNEALRASNSNIQKNIDTLRGYYAPEPAAESPVDTSAVGADANFGTGVYGGSNFPQSGPTNYAQFRGNIGSTLGGYPEGSRTPEASVLFGLPYYTDPVMGGLADPVTGGLATTFGPEFDWLSSPIYGTMYSGIDPIEMRGGGSVPRQTMIGDQPHMLAYINPQEANLLSDLGGTGEPGPGGIPAYRNLDADLGVGAINSGKTYSGSDSAVSGGFDAGAATADDDKPSKSAGQSSNMTSVPTGTVDFTLPPTSSDDEPPVVATIDFGDDDDGSVIKDVTYYDDTGTTEIDAPVVTTDTAYVDPNTGSVTYTDRFGREYSSQAEADAANEAYIRKLLSDTTDVAGGTNYVGVPYDNFEYMDQYGNIRYANRGDVIPNQNLRKPSVGISDREINPFAYTNIGGIGSGPESGGLGITPTPVVDPDAQTGKEAFNLINNLTNFYDNKFDQEGQPVISLDAPVRTDTDAGDPRGDQIVSPTGTGTGLQSDLQRGLGATGPIAARDADMDPFGTGTQLSLQEVKDRVALAEGTADEGGYGRLLGNQEGRFGVDLTNMTVQEVLDFQKQRGPGSYAEYSQGVNKQRGQVRDDGTGKISTPAGKYQIVGATLEDLIDKGVVDPNAKFDAATQEKLGSYLITEKRGFNDLQAGNITREQFEENLGKEFEGIARGLDKGAGSTPLVIGAASETGKKAVQDERDANVEKIQQQIGDQAEPTGVEKFFYDVVGQLGYGLGKGLADELRNASKENRQAIINQHVYALQNGATPKTDKDGNYVGFDISTMDTFADKVLGAEDIAKFLPGGAEDADGDGVPDYDRFQQIIEAQQVAADALPKYDNFKDYLLKVGAAGSTEQGFITPDGKEFFVDAGGNVVEVTDGNVPYEVGGGQSVAEALGLTETTTGDGESGAGKNYTMGPDGAIVCNDAGYVYNSETDMCEPPAEVEQVLSAKIAEPARTFDEILSGVVKPGPTIAPISANIGKMQDGGMAGLNRAADNFLKAMAG